MRVTLVVGMLLFDVFAGVYELGWLNLPRPGGRFAPRSQEQGGTLHGTDENYPPPPTTL